ncbi:MBOAT family protein [Nemania sp. FL0031]|nr:MBOAT family protein [Nemania sp. FL0031]
MSTNNIVLSSPNGRECHLGDYVTLGNGFSKAIREHAVPAEVPRDTGQHLDALSSSTGKLVEGTNGRSSISPLLRRRITSDSFDSSAIATPDIAPMDKPELVPTSSSEDLPLSTSSSSNSGHGNEAYAVDSSDTKLQELLRRDLKKEEVTGKGARPRRGRFRELVFTRQFSTFDRQNQHAASSPFYGFYVLFWIAVVFWIIKMAADNWRKTGSPLGTNDIMKAMFRRDVMVLLISDGVMCGLTGVSWGIQLLVLHDYVDWNRAGWIIQNIWQSLFIANVIGLTLVRDWPWTHTVFFVLHGLVMLMKQHSYAFYNGYLSSVYKKRRFLLKELKKLESMEPVDSASATTPDISELSTSHLARRPSATEYRERRNSLSESQSNEPGDIETITRAIEGGQPLDVDQVLMFERLIKWEIDALADELKGKATLPSHYYPNNVSFWNHYEYIVLPTVVYELQYPRSDSINSLYVAEKAAATFGVIFVMIMVSQTFIYPVVMRTVAMKEMGYTTAQRFAEFPWLLSDLVFPFMMEYLLAWYLIWETVLNILAELTFFADRSFYDAWWNSVSWDQFARDWNRPVHNFLLRHVYHSSISSMRVNKHTATLITFFLSACVHELLMWCIFKKLRGYLLAMQMFQLPLVRLSRTRWLRDKKVLGNAIFWTGILTGPSLLCSLYLIL